jgi:hypothetical protein
MTVNQAFIDRPVALGLDAPFPALRAFLNSVY